tara:strand:- start:8013 stop:8267 length:255 start_codon:yes stop_codon:yes gene_type:complete
LRPIHFEQSNLRYGPPKDKTEEQVATLHAWKGEDAEGTPMVIECWQPSPEEILDILDGKPVWITIMGTGVPPLAVDTVNPFPEK